MTRKKVGLALGGGSARGIAHIGIISELEKNGIPIDYVTGCSMGAVIGGIYVSGCTMDYLEKFALVFDEKKYLDYTIPTKGYVKGDKFKELIKILTKNLNIEKAMIPYACIATNLVTGKLETFTEGSMHEAIRASISIPGIFKPYKYNGNYYVDGGVIDRTAIDAAREIGAEYVIACDVGYRGEELTMPSKLVGVVEQSFTIGAWRITKQYLESADKVIAVDVSGIDADGSKDIELSIKRGREAAEKAIDSIKSEIFI